MVKNCSVDDSIKLKREGALFIDVRTPDEIAEGFIKNAHCIDMSLYSFADEVLKLDKSKTYVLYCRSGNRSYQAGEMMVALEFEDVYNMIGGINEWVELDHPID